MDLQQIGEQLSASYRDVAARYRSDDELEVVTEHHRHLRNILGNLTGSFGHPVDVLDVGCGAGRYFHCLRNVDSLIGLDISEAMLKAAENPVRREQVTARCIELRWENVYFTAFQSETFDLIYSLGMFGNGCPVTVELLNRFHNWLAPGGQLFFNVVDVATLSRTRRTRRQIRNVLYPFLPGGVKRAFDRRAQVPFCGLSKPALGCILRSSRFKDFSISSQVCHSPLWQGRHLECAAAKPMESPR